MVLGLRGKFVFQFVFYLPTQLNRQLNENLSKLVAEVNNVVVSIVGVEGTHVRQFRSQLFSVCQKIIRTNWLDNCLNWSNN